MKKRNWQVALFDFLNVVLFTLLLTSACAGGDPPLDSENQTANADTDLDIDADGEPDSDGDAEADLDGSSDQDADGDLDGDSNQDDPCPVCCAGEVRCAGSDTLETCNDEGTAYLTTACEEASSCTAGSCEPDPICSPGDRQCATSTNVSVCRPDGMGYFTETCAPNEVCFAGVCEEGFRNGETCVEPGDCAGGICRCGATETCDAPSSPYCASDCSLTECSGDQVCWHSDGVSAAEYDHCLRSCDQICSINDRACHEVPTFINGERAWRGGCVPTDLRAVGQRCTSDKQCVNGQCVSDIFSQGVCTQRCEDTGCPSSTACVRLIRPGASGEHWCSPTCSGGTCPLSESSGDWSVECQTRPVYSNSGGGEATVCTPR